METKLFNFNLPTDLKKYLDQVSKSNYTTISQYIITMIVNDMKNNRLVNQITEAKPLIEESLSTLSGTYTSGRKMNIGDKVLFGSMDVNENTIKIVSFHQDEINKLYHFSDKDRVRNKIPHLILIK